ncbi:MAE_28990/MAE_18760 family HEPN-like nuclease [Lactiplantibacillus plantarum]|uniref:MAE_28990/MAE_18760 family HEPN-like nuclease n=1 Tax=Lactiplantibacillus plantarum TaxID=1590 RepID=UPI003907EFAE
MTKEEIEKSYSKRFEEIENMLNFIKKNESKIEPKIKPSDKHTADLKKSLNIQKASTILLLYNLMESTVSKAFNNIIDDIKDNNVSYTDVSKPFQKIWLNCNYQDVFDVSASFKTYKNRTEKILENIFSNESNESSDFLLFSNLITPWQLTGGNIETTQIKKLCKNFDVTFNVPQYVSDNASILIDIKNKRNQLAHGDSSFEEIGVAITTADLISWTQEVDAYLKLLIQVTTDFVHEKRYYSRGKVEPI